MARKPILNFDGFAELLAKLERTQSGAIDEAAERCAKNAAELADQRLREQMQKAKVKPDLINGMPKPDIEREANAWHIKVGYIKEEHMNPANLSDAYKVILLNYGTPHRMENKGQVARRGFVRTAKRKATPQIKKMQEETLAEMMKGLKK